MIIQDLNKDNSYGHSEVDKGKTSNAQPFTSKQTNRQTKNNTQLKNVESRRNSLL